MSVFIDGTIVAETLPGSIAITEELKTLSYSIVGEQ